MTKKTNLFSDNNLFKIGRVLRAHNLKGDLFVKTDCTIMSSTEGAELSSRLMDQQAYIVQDQSRPPREISIQKARFHKNGLIIQSEELNSIQEASFYKEAEVFVSKNIFSSNKGECFYLCEVLQFQVSDKTKGVLGHVFSFSHNGAQDILLIQTATGSEIQVPFIEEYVTQVDYVSKKLFVDLPLDWPNLEGN